VHERDLRREERVLANESLGSVYRINQPEKFGVGLCLASLFAIESVFGKCAEDDFANRLFTLNIGLSHRCPISFGRYREIAREVTPTNSSRLVGRRQCHLEVIRCVF